MTVCLHLRNTLIHLLSYLKVGVLNKTECAACCRSESADRNRWRYDAAGPQWPGKRFDLLVCLWITYLSCRSAACVSSCVFILAAWCDVIYTLVGIYSHDDDNNK